MKLANNALTTEDQVKSHLTIDPSDTGQDDLIRFYINSLSQFVEVYTRRKFAYRADKQIFVAGRGVETMYLPISPIVSISEVEQGGAVVSAASYSIDNEVGALTSLNGVWSSGPGKVAITLTGGYVLPKDDEAEDRPEGVERLPYDLELAIVKLVGRAFNKKDAEGASNAGAGGLNINWQSEMDKDTKAIIDQYRIMYV